MTKVESSNISKVGYYKSTLTIVFTNHRKYAYYNVPEFIHQSLLIAPSKGRFLNQHIKGKYEYKEITMDKQEAIKELSELMVDWINGQYAEFVEHREVPDEEWDDIVLTVLTNVKDDFLHPADEERDWLDTD